MLSVLSLLALGVVDDQGNCPNIVVTPEMQSYVESKGWPALQEGSQMSVCPYNTTNWLVDPIWGGFHHGDGMRPRLPKGEALTP